MSSLDIRRFYDNDPTLTSLDSSERLWYRIDLERICGHLMNNKILTELDISGINLNKAYSGDLISKVLLKNTTLTKLNMRGCRLEEKDCNAIMNALLTNTTLKWLDISYNDVSNDNVCDMLKNNSTLQTLSIGGKYSLYHNTIADNLNNNTTLLELNIRRAPYDYSYKNSMKILNKRKARMKNLSSLVAICWRNLNKEYVEGLPKLLVEICEDKLAESTFDYTV